MENALTADVPEVVVNGNVDTPDAREEVTKAVRRSQNGKAAGEESIEE